LADLYYISYAQKGSAFPATYVENLINMLYIVVKIKFC